MEINPMPDKPEDTRFVWINNLLYTEYMPRKKGFTLGPKKQLVVPEMYRKDILGVGHNLPLTGHMGFKRTLAKISSVFYWPGVHKDVKKYVDSCQKVGYASDHVKVQLGNISVVQTQFVKIQIDIQGLFAPSSSGGTFMLILIRVQRAF